MKSREVIARLKKDGWLLVHIRGSHHHFKHPEKPGRVTVPHPKKDLPKGTFFVKLAGSGRRGDVCVIRS